MLKDIIRVKPLKDFRLHLEFEDGIEGEVDIGKLILLAQWRRLGP